MHTNPLLKTEEGYSPVASDGQSAGSMKESDGQSAGVMDMDEPLLYNADTLHHFTSIFMGSSVCVRDWVLQLRNNNSVLKEDSSLLLLNTAFFTTVNTTDLSASNEVCVYCSVLLISHIFAAAMLCICVCTIDVLIVLCSGWSCRC